MKYGLSTAQLKEIEQVLGRYPAIETAIIFGSRAINSYKEASDVDIAIKGEKVDWSLAATLKDHFEEETYLPFFFDIVAYNTISSDELKQHIDKKGKVIFRKKMREWQEYKLDELGLLQRGKSKHKQRYAFHLYGGKYPFIQTGEVREAKKFIKSYQKTYSDEGLAQSKLWPKGTLCITIAANIAELSILEFDACFPYSILGFISNNKKSDINFIYYTLTHFQRKLKHIGEGSVQDNINLGTFQNVLFPMPPLPEQKDIAEVLSSLDDKIDLLHRQNKTLEQIAEMLFRQWFVEEAGEDWEEVSLYDAINLIGGGTPKTSVPEYWEGDINWLSGGDIATNHKGVIITSEKFITENGLKNSSAKLLPKYSMVISARGTVGKYCMLSEPMAFSQSNYGITPRYKNTYFFNYLLVAHSVDELQSAAYGSVFDTITTNTFKGHSVFLPKKNVIQEFDNEVKSLFKKIFVNSTQIRTLENLRDTLLPKLMSGEVRVASNG